MHSSVKFILLSILLVLVTVWVADASIFLPGKCPTDRPIVKDFNLERYSGLWYEFMRKNDSYEYLGDCNTIVYTPHPKNNTIGIKEYRLLPDPVLEQTDETYAVFSHADQQPLEARFNVSYRWNDPYFENHRIMETDYETYSITYICLPAGPDYSIDEFLIYTREPTVSKELETKLTNTLAKYYNVSLMLMPRQTECKDRISNKVDSV